MACKWWLDGRVSGLMARGKAPAPSAQTQFKTYRCQVLGEPTVLAPKDTEGPL